MRWLGEPGNQAQALLLLKIFCDVMGRCCPARSALRGWVWGGLGPVYEHFLLQPLPSAHAFLPGQAVQRLAYASSLPAE